MTSAPASTMIKTLRSIDLDMRKKQLGRPTVECPCQGNKTHGVIFRGMPLLLCVDCETAIINALMQDNGTHNRLWSYQVDGSIRIDEQDIEMTSGTWLEPPVFSWFAAYLLSGPVSTV